MASDLGADLVFRISPDLPAEATAECDLFHDPRFFRLHASEAGREGRYLGVYDNSAGCVVAAGYAIELSPGHWESPGRGTFGGIQWFTLPSAEALDRAYAELESSIRAAGAVSLRVVLPPADHDVLKDRLSQQVLSSRAYRLLYRDINFSAPVIGDTLLLKMNATKRTYLRRAKRQGVAVEPLQFERRKEAYCLVSDYKRRRGIPMTMTEDSLRVMDERIPESVLWTGAFSGPELVGVSITLRVSSEVLYIAHVADRGATGLKGIQEFLIDRAYLEAHCQGCRLLDFGVSTKCGKPNHGLMRFKQECGFAEGSRFTWLRTW